MSNNLAVAICVHHKPWLIMSTLMTLALQDCQDFDIYFIYQAGDGTCPAKASYADYFQLARKYGGFMQLSPYDKNLKNFTETTKFKKIFTLEFENDHSLDSGAWYKFIKTGLWDKYKHVFFIQEGTVFTRDSVISATLDFTQRNGIDFVSSGHEKRRLPREVALNSNAREKDFKEIDIYHDRKLREVFEVFCRDPKFAEIFNKWNSDFEIETQNHVPDVLDPLRLKLLRSIKRGNPDFLFGKSIYVNTRKRSLNDILDSYQKVQKVIFHKDNNLEWFGCSCQHFLSHRFLEQFSKKIGEYKLYDALEIPFCAGALEIIWGFLPNWLGFDKWFFDGIHRVRKSFTTYRREDDPEGMSYYINKYFRGSIEAKPDGEYIKIAKIDKKLQTIKDILGKIYFA
ncbi:MAG: hypothetical protein PHY94_00430 [Candidatus Omnitrophica bacterium]|nr:hypothetical protein [Candidatus Omnitrophota bacterium]